MKYVLTFRIISWIWRRQDSQWSNPTCCPSYTVNTIADNDLGSQGMNRHGVDQIRRNIPSLASEEFGHFEDRATMKPTSSIVYLAAVTVTISPVPFHPLSSHCDSSEDWYPLKISWKLYLSIDLVVKCNWKLHAISKKNMKIGWNWLKFG